MLPSCASACFNSQKFTAATFSCSLKGHKDIVKVQEHALPVISGQTQQIYRRDPVLMLQTPANHEFMYDDDPRCKD